MPFQESLTFLPVFSFISLTSSFCVVLSSDLPIGSHVSLSFSSNLLSSSYTENKHSPIIFPLLSSPPSPSVDVNYMPSIHFPLFLSVPRPQILILCASLCLLAICVCVFPSLQGPLYLSPSFSLLLLLSSFICFSGSFLAMQVCADAWGRERERAGEGEGRRKHTFRT